MIRPDLADIEPYRWQEGWENAVPDDIPVLRLDQNTQPRSPRWYAGAAARLAAVPVHSYPDSRYGPLREAIAEYAGFPPDQVIPTDGADEALILCALLALSPGDRAYARRPHYAMFENATRLAGGVLTDEPAGAALTWVCTPHNPTGEDTPDEAAAHRDGLVVIDQAYVEFGGTDLSRLARERENTVVVRTLSKAFAVAAARVGYILAPPALAAKFEAIRPPGSISSHSAALARMALADPDEMLRNVADTVAERARMTEALRSLGWQVADSRTNFLFCDLGEPNTATVERLLGAAIVVRTFDALPDHIRMTLGTPADNDRVLEALGAAPPRRPAPAPGGRTATIERRTRETQIACTVDLDGTGASRLSTGIGFLDHMLTALSLHSMVDIDLICTGDLWVDPHHTVEDVAIVLGGALDAALGDRAGIARYGDAKAPLDEALVHATVDLGGRGFSRVDLGLRGPALGELPVTLVPHFADSLSRSGRMAIHLEGSGADDHHVVEAAFKALALALRAGWARDDRRAGALPSTKGAV